MRIFHFAHVFQFFAVVRWRLISRLWAPAQATPIAPLQGGVPIVLGVAGFAEIDAQLLRPVVESECRNLRGRYPSTPFIVLSRLGEGADRLVTDVAMKELSATLIVILGAPRADVVSTFTSQASKDEFDALLAKAESVVEIETPPDDNGGKQPGAQREAQHAKAGAAIAEHSQILFALCSDQQDGEPGCPEDVVKWRLQGYAPKLYSFNANDISPLDPPASGLVIRINPSDCAITKLKAGGRGGKATARRRLPEYLAEFDWLLLQTEWFNRLAGRERERIAKAQSVIVLPEDAPQRRQETAARALASAQEIDAAFRASDTLSVDLAKQTRSADKWIHALAVVAFILFSVLETAPVFALAYFVIASAMVVLWAVIRLPMTENRFLEYRALAEAMRVLFFWRLSGVSKPVWLGYLSKHSGVVLWVRHAICAIEFQDLARRKGGQRRPAQPFPESDGLSLAREHWINGQLAFFTTKGLFHRRQQRLWTWTSRLGFGVSYLLALLLVALATARWPEAFSWGTASQEQFIHWVQVTLGAAAAIGVAAGSYAFRRADGELRKQYSAQRRIFELAQEELQRLDRPSSNGQISDGYRSQDILAQLGREALAEHGEWLWLRHSRPFDVPK